MLQNRKLTRTERRALLEELSAAAKHATPGPCAAHSQDFLYDEDGVPLGSQPGKRPLEEVRPCTCLQQQTSEADAPTAQLRGTETAQ